MFLVFSLYVFLLRSKGTDNMGNTPRFVEEFIIWCLNVNNILSNYCFPENGDVAQVTLYGDKK